MEQTKCFDTAIFLMLVTLIQEKGETIQLQERLLADKNDVAKEISFKNFHIALVTSSENKEIIVIDNTCVLPTYICTIKNEILLFSAYESRFDIDKDIEDRKNNWCQLVTEILKES